MSMAARVTLIALLLVPLRGGAEEKEYVFAVVGDNRGYSDGRQSAAFLKIVGELARANPALILHTGDMIDGDVKDADVLARQWNAYKQAIAPLKMPIYHAPGNHDLFDAASAALYQKFCGKTYYSVESGGCLFIALDTETLDGRLGDAQWKFLTQALAGAGERPTFLFLHRPLFPFGAHVKFCLDEFPEERDRLHRLFVEHRRNVRGVFLGHEHLYAHDERDGIHYYTCGGGGAVLYAPPELGGFYHYLTVRVKGKDVQVDLHKVLLRPEAPRGKAALAAETLVDGFESPLYWSTWNFSTRCSPTTQFHTDGSRALRFDFDGERYPWPTLFTILSPAADLSSVGSISVDVRAPDDLPAGFTMALAVSGHEGSSESPRVAIKPGWNTFTADLTAPWLADDGRKTANALLWNLDCNRQEYAGSLVFDNLRAAPRGPGPGAAAGRLRESWETGLLWQAYNSAVTQQKLTTWHTQGIASMKLVFDLARCPSPRLYAPLDPRLDLGAVQAISLDVLAPRELRAARLRLVVVSDGQRYLAPPQPLAPGQQHLAFALEETWLPKEARASAEQFELVLDSEDTTQSSWIAVDNLRAGR